MLWQFTVKNYKTFKDKATLSLIATNYDKKTLEAENIYPDGVIGKRILKSAVVYGANASGKSTLVNAIAFMRHFVLRSSGGQQGDTIGVDPFRLNVATVNEPTEFEVIFSLFPSGSIINPNRRKWSCFTGMVIKLIYMNRFSLRVKR